MKSAKTKPSLPAAREQAPFFAKESDQDFVDAETEAPFFATSSLRSHNTIQPKLTVGAVNDPYEKEADSMAEQVVDQREEPKEELSVDKNAAKKARRKPIFESNADPRDDEIPENRVLRKENSSEKNTSPPHSVESRLNNSKGSGDQLPHHVNAEMGRAIGSDFSNVRIHKDSGAADLSRDLHAQAFTHGNDIYFNSGKYDTNSTEGRRLLAHELTHTVQQGASPNSSSINKAPEIQREGKKEEPNKDVKDIDAETLKSMGEKNTIGFLSKNGGGKVEVRLRNFPSKQYIGPFLTKDQAGVEKFAEPPFLKPTKERKTKQAAIWKKEALPRVTKLIKNIIDKNKVNGTEYMLKLKKKEASAATGTLDQIAAQVAVPFWGMDGLPISYQIEHKVDWQIAGGNYDVDVISNLILLDAKSNIEVGQSILNQMRNRYEDLIKFYKTQKKVNGLADKFGSGTGIYDIYCETVVAEGKNVGQSLISISNFEEKSVQTPFTETNIEVSELKIPDNHFILKTAKSGAGMFVPMNLDNDFIKIAWENKDLKSITLKNVVKNDAGVIDLNNPDKKLDFKKEGDRRYKVDSAGFAVVLKNMFRGIKAMSPLQWSEIDFNPLTGLNATAKIDTGLDFLKGVDLALEVVNSEFIFSVTVSSDILKGKLPKPFDVDYSSLTLYASSKKKFGGEGEVGFSVAKIGKGSVHVEMQGDNFGLTGTFSFDGKEKFEKAELTFTYVKEGEIGKWKAGGNIVFGPKLLKSIKSGNVNIAYDGKTFEGSGQLELVLPKFKGLILNGSIKETGDFIVTAAAKIDSLPGVKDVDATVTVKKEGAEYNLGMTGKATPSLPKIPGLTPKPLTITYENKIFKIEGGVDYSKGKIKGSLTVGVTNGAVEAGKPTAGKEESSDLLIYGKGSADIDLFPGMKAGIIAELDTKGDVFIGGKLDFDKDLFSGIKKSFNLFKIAQTIPLIGVPFAAIVLRFGGNADLLFDWKPLKLSIHTELEKSKLDDLEKGKLGGGFDVGLKSTADAKIQLTLSIGIGAELAVFVVSLNGNGTIGFGITGDLGTSLKGTWSLEKGLQLTEGDATFNTGLFVFAKLSGTVLVELNMLVSRVNIYEYELGSIEKSLKPSDFSLGVKVPMKIDQAGKLEGFDLDKVSFTPEFKKGNEDRILNKITGTETSPPPVPDQMQQAKVAMRQEIRHRLETKGANSSVDMAAYATTLRTKMQNTTPQLSMEINQIIEEEFRNVEYKQFEDFRIKLLTAKGTTKEKLAKVDAFEKTHNTVPAADIEILRQEVRDQPPSTTAPTLAQRKEMDAPDDDAQKEAALPDEKEGLASKQQEKKNLLEGNAAREFEDKKDEADQGGKKGEGVRDGEREGERETAGKGPTAAEAQEDIKKEVSAKKEGGEGEQATAVEAQEHIKHDASAKKEGGEGEQATAVEAQQDIKHDASAKKEGGAGKGEEKENGKDEKQQEQKEEQKKEQQPIEAKGGSRKNVATVPNVAEDVSEEFHPLPSLADLLTAEQGNEKTSTSVPSVQKQDESSAQPDIAGLIDGCVGRIGTSRKNNSDTIEKEVATLQEVLALNAETVRASTLGTIWRAIAATKGEISTAREELNASVASTQVQITIQFVLQVGETIRHAQKTRTNITDLFSNHKKNIDKAAGEGITDANKLREGKQQEARDKVSEQIKRARSMREQRAGSYPDTERGRIQKEAARSMANETISEIAGKTPDTIKAIAEVIEPIPDEFRKQAEEAKQGLNEHSTTLVADIDAKVIEVVGQLQTSYNAAQEQIKLAKEKLDGDLTKIEETAVTQLEKLIPQVNGQVDLALRTSVDGLEASKANLLGQLGSKADEAIVILKGAENPDRDGMNSFTNTIVTFLDTSTSESIGLFQQNVLLMEDDTANIYDNVLETTGIFKAGTNKALMKWRQAKEVGLQSLLERSTLDLKTVYDSMAIPFDQVAGEVKTALSGSIDELKAGFAKSLKDAQPKIDEAITKGLAKNEEVLVDLDGNMKEAADDAAWDYDHPILSAVGDVLAFIGGLLLGILAVLALVVVVIIAFKLAIVGLVALGISLAVAKLIVVVAGLALLARGVYKSYTARTERGEKGGFGTFLWSLGDVTGVSSIVHGVTAEGLSPFERGFSIGEGIATIASFFLARKIDTAISGKLPASIVNPGGSTPPIGPRALTGGAGSGRLADVIPISRGKIIRAGRTGGGGSTGGGTTLAYGGRGGQGATALAKQPQIAPQVAPQPVAPPQPSAPPVADIVGKAGKAPAIGVAPEIGAGAAAGLKSKTKQKEKEKEKEKLYTWRAMSYQERIGGLTYSKKMGLPDDYFIPNGHHVWPKTLGGIESQTLMTVIRIIHTEEMHYGRSPVGSPVVVVTGSLYEFLQNLINSNPTYGPDGLDILQGRDLTHPGGGNSANPLLIAAMGKKTKTAKSLAGFVRNVLTTYYAMFDPFTDPSIPYPSYRKGLNDSYNALT